jgi:hypothetical protein
MRLYGRLGRREAALRQYQQCVDALKRELSTPPEPETTQLYQELLRSRASAQTGPRCLAPRAGAAGPGPVADLRSTATAAQPESLPPTNLGVDGGGTARSAARRRGPNRSWALSCALATIVVLWWQRRRWGIGPGTASWRSTGPGSIASWIAPRSRITLMICRRRTLGLTSSRPPARVDMWFHPGLTSHPYPFRVLFGNLGPRRAPWHSVRGRDTAPRLFTLNRPGPTRIRRATPAPMCARPVGDRR